MERRDNEGNVELERILGGVHSPLTISILLHRFVLILSKFTGLCIQHFPFKGPVSGCLLAETRQQWGLGGDCLLEGSGERFCVFQ